MGRDCLWDREDADDINPVVPGDIDRDKLTKGLSKSPGPRGILSPKWCSLLFQRESRPRIMGGADQLCSIYSVLLLAVPEAVSSHSKRRRSTVQYIFWVAPQCPRGSLVPYESKEKINCAVYSVCCSSLSPKQSRPIQSQGESVSSGLAFQGQMLKVSLFLN